MSRGDNPLAHNQASHWIVESVGQHGCLKPLKKTVEASLRVLSNRPALIGIVPICQDTLKEIYERENWVNKAFGELSNRISYLPDISETDHTVENEPQIPLGVELENGVMLLGIDIIDSHREIATLLETDVYWWYQGRLWIQRIILNNYALGSSFHPIPQGMGNGVKGYYRRYSAPSSAYTTVSCGEAQCLRIENVGYESSGIASHWITVDQDDILVQRGGIRTDGSARGFIGVNWNAPTSEDSNNTYQYTVSTWSGTDWQSFTRAFTPPSGASKAQVWLLNFGAEGVVEFRDTFLFALSLPQKNDTGFTIRNGRLEAASWEEFIAGD